MPSPVWLAWITGPNTDYRKLKNIFARIVFLCLIKYVYAIPFWGFLENKQWTDQKDILHNFGLENLEI